MIVSVAGISYLNQPCIAPKMISEPVNATQGYSFKIIAPDNRYCIIEGAVLSKGNYTQMQNNVGVFTVLNKTPVNASPTYNYCELAKWLYDAHTNTYPDIQKKFKDNMLPLWCYPELFPPKTIVLEESLALEDNMSNVVDIPEFSSVMLIMTLALLPLFVWKFKK